MVDQNLHDFISEFRSKRNRVPILECGEPLVEIPVEIPRVSPHPYSAVGAPYGGASPFFLRKEVVTRLLRARDRLQKLHRGWELMIADGYRPIAVQSFMIEFSISQLLEKRGRTRDELSLSELDEIRNEVLQIWAQPSANPDTPPPHSTGGAIDLTIVDERGVPVDMGSELDALPPLCLPDYFASGSEAASFARHQNRELLRTVMVEAGFHRLPYEWWHFSYGDQSWALLESEKRGSETPIAACYGGVSPFA